MTPETIFAIANNGILIFWLLLIVAPGWRETRVLVLSPSSWGSLTSGCSQAPP
jgi:hypothetical protein